MVSKFRILLINGPNLNLLGTREPRIYGDETLSDIIVSLYKTSDSLGMNMDHFQSNAEHELINYVHKSYQNVDFIIINPAAFTHTSIALRDAFLSINIAFIEIHLSNIYTREKFRHSSYLSDIALGVICGFGVDGYHFALHMAYKYLSKNINK
ncbi:type II 3-dehydroquinate dehydratase [Blochmannia endosymbiont of Camponotus sp.]|uniref:type II 3-dehydroquinate dehydratase n=1 Tax=Blochmannia endosymbiont of Camponotus sp. TaxID=700220 RepID=UPI00202414D0|nr:type II 3-dehydroquinate dehydratase [Blochmannia endosymbiont of Camponotus sp.]URJ31019.1 type II 3-dehydroquinate dehydratase [Blochmannia endosymbiont of Camponotus sp.]